jgi:DNA polymerase I
LTPLNYIIVNTTEDLNTLANTLNNLSEFVFDLEATGLATHSEEIRIVGIGFCWQEGIAYYVPFNGSLKEKDILDAIRPSLENETIGKIGHNVKYDTRLLNRFSIDVKNISFDTMVASYCIYGDRIKHNLDDLTLHHLNHIKVRTKTLIPKKSKTNPNPSMMDCDFTQVGIYCCEDVDYTYRLALVFRKILNQPNNSTAKDLFYEVDMPLVYVLNKIECEGIKLDVNKLYELRDIVSAKLITLQKEVNSLAGRELSLTRPVDIGTCLYEEQKVQDKLKVKIPKTASGQLSTAAATLDTLKDEPIVAKIIEYKFYTKLMSTYINPLPEYISKHTGLLHPFFSQTRTATGRLSCSEPNVQQQPSRSEIGRRIREAFISRYEGGQILAVDYSQAELRILAHMGQEQVFINAFLNDEDVHIAVASEVVYEVPKEQVTKPQRTACKTVNFGLLYGMRAKKLAATLGIEVHEAQTILNKYMGKMSGLKSFLDNSRETLKQKGYTENYFGRRRYIPKIYSEDQLDQWSAEREGANNIIQSTNADMIRLAMVRIQQYLDDNNLKSKMILQVHDELVFDVHPDELDIIFPAVKNIMENIVNFNVLMKTDGKYADNWSLAH